MIMICDLGHIAQPCWKEAEALGDMKWSEKHVGGGVPVLGNKRVIEERINQANMEECTSWCRV